MLLLIDAGNTRVKWAVLPHDDVSHERAPGAWVASGFVEHAQLTQLPGQWQPYPISRVLLSNVAGNDMRAALEQMLSRVLELKPVSLEWFASVAQLAGIRNRYQKPTQLGCDRFASAIGAHVLFPSQALIIATCGTATTIDAVTADGVFMGGMILPGLGLMASSLAKNTAQLPEVAEVARNLVLSEPFADNTLAAIASGCLTAQSGAIERAVAAHTKMQGTQGPVCCILSGGAASLIVPHLSISCQKVDNLVLIGLQIAARHTPS